MSQVAIEVRQLSKSFHLGQKVPYGRFSELLVHLAKAPFHAISRKSGKQDNELWALKDVDFQVKTGEVVGIIGRNGAGKSTLLKILSRITEPTAGQVRLKGRVGSLLEVGSGFHPELTGRENIFLNGAIMGMTRAEIRSKFDAIVDFSEVELFLDTPVKRYSSGMYMKLAFAVAAHLEAQIMIIDEVLAVGDIAFQKKCLGKMDEIAKHGRTVLFVSHNMGAVRELCSTGIVLDQGRVQFSGEISDCIDQYLGDRETSGRFQRDSKPGATAWIKDLSIVDGLGDQVVSQPHTDPFTVQIGAVLKRKMRNLSLSVHIHDSQQTTILFDRYFDPESETETGLAAGEYVFSVVIPGPLLVPGEYSVSVHLVQRSGEGLLDSADHAVQFEVIDAGGKFSMRDLSWRGKVCPDMDWRRSSG